MPVITGVSSTLRNPQTFHVFTYQFAARSLVPLPIRVALVGAQATAGATAVAGTIYEISDAVQTDTLFGVSSELAIMCRKAFETGARLGRGPRLFAVSITPPGASVATIKTVTAAGTATADGVGIVEVAGRTIFFGIRSGDTANTVATALSNAAKAIAENLPLVPSVVGAVVSFTAPQVGVNGNDVAVTVKQTVAGITLTPATPTPGTGVYDITAALDALAAVPMDGIAIANHAAADITDINSDVALRWNYAEKRFRFYFLGESGTIGTATALASAANHQSTLIASMEGCKSTPSEMATALMMATFSRERPNANYDGLQLPLYPPDAATLYTPTEIETALAVGVTPLGGVVDPFTRAVTDGVVRIIRMVTTKTTQNSQPFEVLKDLAVARTGVYVSQQRDAAYAARWSGDANPDGTLLTDDVIDQIKDFIIAMMRELEGLNILRNVDADIAQLVVERDAGTPGRVNVSITYTVVVGLHQITFVHKVQL
jgi:phage tail sheath gpL-like